MSAPSEDVLRTRISAVLETANLDDLTVKKLLKQLSEEFGVDLSARAIHFLDLSCYRLLIFFFFFLQRESECEKIG